LDVLVKYARNELKILFNSFFYQKGPMVISERIPDSRVPTTPITEALGQSEPFLDFQERLSRVAPVNRPVLLVGERGTGKELAASRLHFLSNRWQGPLVALNCAALSPTLIESELFGYERGAFTGAQQRRVGRFEAADEGTLFLDEIGTIPLEVQEKILRVVEYGTFERVGSPQSVEVDVRIIAATNADLGGLVERGRFKQDLLDRLSFEVLCLPPLRDRREDILLLARHFAAAMALVPNSVPVQWKNWKAIHGPGTSVNSKIPSSARCIGTIHLSSRK